jgi:hypothetical protein
MLAFVISRVFWIVCRLNPWLLSNLMGRAGIEPATLGLKVRPNKLKQAAP